MVSTSLKFVVPPPPPSRTALVLAAHWSVRPLQSEKRSPLRKADKGSWDQIKILQDFRSENQSHHLTTRRAAEEEKKINKGKPNSKGGNRRCVCPQRRDLHRRRGPLPHPPPTSPLWGPTRPRVIPISCLLCQRLSALTHSTAPQKIS